MGIGQLNTFLWFVEYLYMSLFSYSNLTGGSGSIAQHSHQRIGKNSNTNSNSYYSVSGTPPPINKLLTASGGALVKIDQRAPRIGPGGRRMVKSFSQDAASSMTSAATIAMNTLSSGKCKRRNL